jgi:hypothetical protein
MNPAARVIPFSIAALCIAVIVGCSSTTQPPVAPAPTQTSGSDSASTGQLSAPTPVGMRAPASFGNGMQARVLSNKSIEVTGNGPGEKSGAGIRLEIELTNNSSSPVDIASTGVNLFYGAARTPASPASSADIVFSGSLAPNTSARGTYSFLLPGNAGAVTVEISYSADQPTVAFVGKI